MTVITVRKLSDENNDKPYAIIKLSEKSAVFTSVRVNPWFYKSSHAEGCLEIVPKESCKELKDGDSFALLADGFWFQIQFSTDADGVVESEKTLTVKPSTAVSSKSTSRISRAPKKTRTASSSCTPARSLSSKPSSVKVPRQKRKHTSEDRSLPKRPYTGDKKETAAPSVVSEESIDTQKLLENIQHIVSEDYPGASGNSTENKIGVTKKFPGCDRSIESVELLKGFTPTGDAEAKRINNLLASIKSGKNKEVVVNSEENKVEESPKNIDAHLEDTTVKSDKVDISPEVLDWSACEFTPVSETTAGVNNRGDTGNRLAEVNLECTQCLGNEALAGEVITQIKTDVSPELIDWSASEFDPSGGTGFCISSGDGSRATAEGDARMRSIQGDFFVGARTWNCWLSGQGASSGEDSAKRRKSFQDHRPGSEHCQVADYAKRKHKFVKYWDIEWIRRLVAILPDYLNPEKKHTFRLKTSTGEMVRVHIPPRDRLPI